MDEITLEEFWEAAGEKPYGCTELQVAFIKALLSGAKGAAAARMAGYKGTSDALSVRATRLKKNSKIQALLKAATQATESHLPKIASKEELLIMLTEGARNGDTPTARVKSQELLARHYALFNEAAHAREEAPPAEVLREMPHDEFIPLKQFVDAEYERRCELAKRKEGNGAAKTASPH